MLTWQKQAQTIYTTVILATITGGTPILALTPDGPRYAIQYTHTVEIPNNDQ